MEIPKMPEIQPVQPQRTFILWFMSICSMVDAVSNIFSYLFFIFMLDRIAEVMPKMGATMGMSKESVDLLMESIAAVTTPQWIMLIAVEVLMFVGVLLMIWKLNQIGFHLYAVGQILNIVITNFVIGGKMALDFTAIITVVFLIAIYAMHLRFMKPLKESDESQQDDVETPQ